MKNMSRIGIAVIGCGRIGTTHIESILELNDIAFLAAVVDDNIDIAERAAKKYNCNFYDKIEEALADPSVDAVVVCLPNDLHAPVSMTALEAGKHTLVEKPFALSFKDAEQMVNLAHHSGLIVMCAQSYRFLPDLQEAQKRIKSEIGEPFSMLYACALNFDKNKAPAWWKFEKKTGGPVIQFLGPHIIDATLWFFEGKIPEYVYAQAASFNPDFEGPDEATILIKFRDGAMATNYLSINTRPMLQECLITGPKGRIYYKQGDPSEGQVGTSSIELYIGEKRITCDSKKNNNIKNEEENFIRSILKTAEPFVKTTDTLLQMKIIEAAKKSMNNRRAVEII